MELRPAYEVADLGSLDPGTLFMTEHAGGPLKGISLARTENDPERTPVIILASVPLDQNNPQWPCRAWLDPDHGVISLGTDWVLEQDLASAGFSNEGEDQAGTIIIGRRGVFVRVARPPGQITLGMATVALSDFGLARQPTSQATIRRWQIWTSEGERLRVGATPFFVFG